MIAGATLGAVIAIVVNGNGKALYGVPIGTAAGFVVSMAMASHSEQSVDKPIDRQAERFNEP